MSEDISDVRRHEELAQSLQRTDAARDALRHLIALDPSLSRYYVEEINYLAEAGSVTESCNRVHDYFLRFGYDASGALRIMRRLAEAPVEPVFNTTWQEIAASGFTAPAIRVLYVQGLLLLGQVAEAQRQFDQARSDIEKTHAPDGGWLEGTQALFDLLRADTPSARANLLTFCTHTPLDPNAFRFLYGTLVHNGRRETANETTIIAKNRFPAITGLIPVEIEQPVAESAVPQITPEVAVPRPPAPTNDIPRPLPPEDLTVELGKIDTDLQAGQWDEAVRRLEALRNIRDDKFTPELLYRRIEVYGARSNLIELRSSLQRLLLDPNPPMAKLRDFALKLHQEGRVDSALVIVQVIARNRPDSVWAENLGREWSQSLRTKLPESANQTRLNDPTTN